jgi:hypothetical protein
MKWASFSLPNFDNNYHNMKWTSFLKFLTDRPPNFDHNYHDMKWLATEEGHNLARRVEYARQQVIL